MGVHLSLLVYLFLTLKLFCQYQQKSTFGRQFLVSSTHLCLACLYSKIWVGVVSEFLLRTLLGCCLFDICLLFPLTSLFGVLIFSSEVTFLAISITCGFQLVKCSFGFLLEFPFLDCFYICFSLLEFWCVYLVYFHCLASTGIYFFCFCSIIC